MQQTWVQSLGQEDPLEKEMAAHSSILALEISWTEDLGRPQFMGLQIGRHDLEIKQQQLQFSRSVVRSQFSRSLRPHGLQHARPPCPSSTPGVYSNSCPLSW